MATNSFGLDVAYFSDKLGLVLRDLGNFTPEELARALARLARTACAEVLGEEEFIGHAFPVEQESGLYAIHYRDNWDGEGDTYYMVAERTKDGRWLDNDSGRQLLEYQGSAVLEMWPLTSGTSSDRYRAELYDEVWEKARSMGYGNVTNALAELERLRAAPAGVRDGWRLIPAEPSIEMTRAIAVETLGNASVHALKCAYSGYRAMLSAAPPAAEQPANPKWARMDPSLVVDFLRHASVLDADLVGEMLEFAIHSAEQPDTVKVPREKLEQLLDRVAHREDPDSIANELCSILLGKEGE